jgi:hypothetical protein
MTKKDKCMRWRRWPVRKMGGQAKERFDSARNTGGYDFGGKCDYSTAENYVRNSNPEISAKK